MRLKSFPRRLPVTSRGLMVLAALLLAVELVVAGLVVGAMPPARHSACVFSTGEAPADLAESPGRDGARP